MIDNRFRLKRSVLRQPAHTILSCVVQMLLLRAWHLIALIIRSIFMTAPIPVSKKLWICFKILFAGTTLMLGWKGCQSKFLTADGSIFCSKLVREQVL